MRRGRLRAILFGFLLGALGAVVGAGLVWLAVSTARPHGEAGVIQPTSCIWI